MSLTIYLIVGFIAITANATFVWQDDEDDSFNRHHEKFPHINFPDFPQFDFPDFPEFPTIPPIEFPKPRKGFSGVSVSASSSAGIGTDGKEHKSGGATIVTRTKDGVEKKMSVGDDDGPSNVVSMPFWQPDIPSMDADTPKSGQPGKNEHFFSSSASAFSSVSNNNGVSHLEGAANVYQNVNGKTDEKSIHVTDNEV